MTAQAGKGSANGNGALRGVAASLGDSERDRTVARNARRVVMASMGVMQEQKAQRKRTRSVVLAALVILLLVIGPLAWLVVDYFNSGGHIGDLTGEFTLWAGILCSGLLAAALVAGWLRKR
jgi:hypothetical protein